MGATLRSGKYQRLEARVTSEQKSLIQHAAELEGRSVTDYIIASVEVAARETIRAHQILELTVRETEALFAALENPPEPNEQLRAAAREYREFVGR
jgi:uncharacterized protein (DUF1778 family)